MGDEASTLKNRWSVQLARVIVDAITEASVYSVNPPDLQDKIRAAEKAIQQLKREGWTIYPAEYVEPH